jgi:hypothetical protein
MLITRDEKFAIVGDYNYGVRIMGIGESLYTNTFNIEIPIEIKMVAYRST